MCPLCKAKNRTSDLRPHYLSNLKPSENDLLLKAELQNARAELDRTKSELALLKTSLASPQPDSTVDDTADNRSRDKSIRRNLNRAHKSRILNVSSQTHLLDDACCLEYSSALNACVIASSSSSTRYFRPHSMLKVTTHGEKIESRLAPKYGLSMIYNWFTTQPIMVFISLFDMPITCTAISPFDARLFLVASKNGCVKVVKVSLHETVDPASSNVPNMSADILVELVIENTEITAICWDVSSPSTVYIATGSTVHVFDLKTASPTVALEIPCETRKELKSEKIFKLISLPSQLESESPRLLIGATWGIYQVLLTRYPSDPWNMSEAIVLLGTTGNWLETIANQTSSAQNHDEGKESYAWNMLDSVKMLPTDGDTETKEKKPEDFLFVCGFQTPSHQKFMTFDLKLNLRTDVPAPMRPLAFDTRMVPDNLPSRATFTDLAPPRPRSSACVFREGANFYAIVISPQLKDVIAVQAQRLLWDGTEEYDVDKMMSLMSKDHRTKIKDCSDWTLISKDSAFVLAAISPVGLYIILPD